MIEDAHKEVYAARSASKNPSAEFNACRNKILDIQPQVINQRIKEYCLQNNIAVTNKITRKPKREKILLIDTYEAVRNAVWDFLQIHGEINALNLANLVRNMIRIEKGEIMAKNKTDLFHEKQDLGEFTDFEHDIRQIKQVKSAREILQLRESLRSPRL
ncbi:MAG TPA: hypothetical protein VNS32_00360 [Flavisolibacter sp.]|nr:hypothetical protein [Flavisolibacter sp.]